jgi:uncharacterized repeat protein (TIGR01451 family)
MIVFASSLLMIGAFVPAVSANHGLELTTPYTAIAVAPGSDVSFDLSISANRSARVGLSVEGVPQGWTASLQGGGFVVDGVLTQGTTAAEVRLDVTIPADAAEGPQRITVRASSEGETVDLPLDIRVATQAAGNVTIDTEIPVQEGASDQTFRFPLTLRNDTAEDITASVTASGPPEWQVETQIAGQAQAASAIVEAGDTLSVEVSVTPAELAEAGDYEIPVTATAGERTINGALTVRLTGSFQLAVTTPENQPLSARGEAGSTITKAIVLRNDGTADLANVQLTGTGPEGWNIAFDQETVASIAAGQEVTVNARITPSGEAIAGDYNVTIRAEAQDQANESETIRVTVETSPIWGLIGIGLIALVIGGLLWVFRTYGRR